MVEAEKLSFPPLDGTTASFGFFLPLCLYKSDGVVSHDHLGILSGRVELHGGGNKFFTLITLFL